MIKQFWSGLLTVLLLSGCGWDGTATRPNDFTTLTSIQIVAPSSTIANGTSTKLKVIGSYSGLFTRDVTDQATWSSDNTAVAGFITASSPSRVSGVAAGSAILKATVGGVSTSYTLTVSSATITAMTIAPAAVNVPSGLSTQLAANGTFSDASTQDLTFDATWTSGTPAVATVSDLPASKGLAKGLAIGSTTITATFGAVSGTATLNVTAAALQSIAVSPANPSILSLSSGSFQALGTYSDGSTSDVSSQVTWSSSRTDLATISNTGVATTLAQGTALIGASLAGIGGVTNLKVTGGSLTGITITPANPKLVTGSSGRLTATGAFSNGSTRDITGAVAWSTADPAITVTKAGGNLAWLNAPAVTVTGITAKSGTLTGATTLTVTAPLLSSLVISPASFSGLPVGASTRFTTTASFNDGTTQDVTSDTNWTSTGTASVGNTGLNKGLVSGTAAGPATITAVYGGLTVTATVAVAPRTISTLTITGTSAVTSGNQIKFTATAVYTDTTSQVVTEDTTWAIDKPNVAILADSINQPGQIVAVDTGSAALTATFDGKTSTATVTVP
jgi:hypothetical protein